MEAAHALPRIERFEDLCDHPLQDVVPATAFRSPAAVMSVLRNLKRQAISSGAVASLLRVRRGNPIILMYHGVTADPAPRGITNFAGQHIPLATFVEHVRLLRRYRRVCHVNEMVERLIRSEDLRDHVAITFDDGYLNNATVAAPVLADHNLTATIFVTTGYLSGGRWMWGDLIEHSMNRTAVSKLHVPELQANLPLRNDSEKIEAVKRLKTLLKPMRAEKRAFELQSLLGQLDVPAEPPYGDYRFMGWDDAKRLDAAGFEIGAHTINHPILSRITQDEARSEILGSRDSVVREIGRCCRVFCYPNGKETDITPEIRQICREHFTAALSSIRGSACGQDLFALHRIGVPLGDPANLAWALLRER